MNSCKFIENRKLYRGGIRLSYTKLRMVVIVDFMVALEEMLFWKGNSNNMVHRDITGLPDGKSGR